MMLEKFQPVNLIIKPKQFCRIPLVQLGFLNDYVAGQLYLSEQFYHDVHFVFYPIQWTFLQNMLEFRLRSFFLFRSIFSVTICRYLWHQLQHFYFTSTKCRLGEMPTKIPDYFRIDPQRFRLILVESRQAQ